MPVAQLNGTAIFYLRHGHGLPCLVMHGGLGCDHTYMHPWMDALGDTFELIYYDHRGKSWAFASCKEQVTNLEKAKKLLAEAGFANGFKMTIKVGADYKSQVNIAQVIQAQIKPLKIDITVAPMEWGAFLDDVVTKGNFDAVILGWIGAVDPNDFLYYQFRTGEKFNFYKFSDKRSGQPARPSANLG